MRSVQRLFGEAKGKMNGYVALLAFRYSNLCVKADVMSLLPVTVTIDGEDTNIENVADVAVPKDDMLAVMPKDPDHLDAIGQGVMDAHPEFLKDVVQNGKSEDEDDQYLTFTMPDVDEERFALLNDSVATLYEQCKTKLNDVHEQYSKLINEKLKEESSEASEEVKKQLKELYDYYDKTSHNMTETKKKEIENGYQRYRKENKKKNKAQHDDNAAHNQEAGQHMTMG